MPQIIDLSVTVSPRGNLQVMPQIIYRCFRRVLARPLNPYRSVAAIFSKF